MKLTKEQIDAGRSRAGGWTAKQLRQWGVPWPPPKGWRKALLAGEFTPPEDAAANQPLVLVLGYPGQQPPDKIVFNGMIFEPGRKQPK